MIGFISKNYLSLTVKSKLNPLHLSWSSCDKCTNKKKFMGESFQARACGWPRWGIKRKQVTQKIYTLNRIWIYDVGCLQFYLFYCLLGVFLNFSVELLQKSEQEGI